MTDYEKWSLALSLIAVVVATSGLFYMSFQVRAVRRQTEQQVKIIATQNDWHMRDCAQQALKEYNLTTVANELQQEFSFLNCKESIPLNTVKDKFEKLPSLQLELHQLLNYYEGLARGVYHAIYDEDVIKSARRSSMTKVLRAFQSYIEDRRKSHSPNAWTELESLVAKWGADSLDKPKRPSANIN